MADVAFYVAGRIPLGNGDGMNKLLTHTEVNCLIHGTTLKLPIRWKTGPMEPVPYAEQTGTPCRECFVNNFSGKIQDEKAD